MKLKQYIKHGAIVVALSATTVFAATSWPTTAGIENGQIIQAPTIRDGLQFLYERRWDLRGTGDNILFTNNSVGIGDDTPETKLDIQGQVSATGYCDENGENCFTPGEETNSVWDIVFPATVVCRIGDLDVYRGDQSRNMTLRPGSLSRGSDGKFVLPYTAVYSMPSADPSQTAICTREFSPAIENWTAGCNCRWITGPRRAPDRGVGGDE